MTGNGKQGIGYHRYSKLMPHNDPWLKMVYEKMEKCEQVNIDCDLCPIMLLCRSVYDQGINVYTDRWQNGFGRVFTKESAGLLCQDLRSIGCQI